MDTNPNLDHQPTVTPQPEAPASVAPPATEPTPATPVSPVQPVPPAAPAPIKGAKLAFLVLLIAGASAMALVSIVALLIGGFNDFIGKALTTIFILFSHSLLILTILTAMNTQELKRSMLASTIVTVAGLNILTSILGLWNVIPSSLAWHLAGLYFILIGGAFIFAWLQRALIGRPSSDGVFKAALAVVILFVATLVPWVIVEEPSLPAIYYRAVGALAILFVTLIIIGTILRQIAISHGVNHNKSVIFGKISTPLQLVYSLVGAVTAFVWMAGFIGFYFSATDAQYKVDGNSYQSDTY